MTVLEVIQRSTEYLAKRGVELPRLQIELLLAHMLKLPRMKLYLDFERQLSDADLQTLRGFVQRRAAREPLQHIVGATSFCGLELAVTRAALVPRPETETLAELAWNHLSPLAPRPSPVLDFGTGTGCLAITLAVKCPNAQVHALDMSAEALALARLNAARHGVAERIAFHQGDGFAALPAGPRFDLIVANPPYIPSAEIASLEPEVRDHDPRLALDGGKDGLDCFRLLACEAGARLKPGGALMAEFGDGQAPELRELFAAWQWSDTRIEKDLTGRERFLVAHTAGA
ncbi:MAG: peptide chain release factor N(5)-glutamine methyltransferase [Verrucomicrobia bacterium]|nr:peptide chain release factor N(5)-glutamine methyltransferase [Verrucomicrobiota bacterium]